MTQDLADISGQSESVYGLERGNSANKARRRWDFDLKTSENRQVEHLPASEHVGKRAPRLVHVHVHVGPEIFPTNQSCLPGCADRNRLDDGLIRAIGPISS